MKKDMDFDDEIVLEETNQMFQPEIIIPKKPTRENLKRRGKSLGRKKVTFLQKEEKVRFINNFKPLFGSLVYKSQFYEKYEHNKNFTESQVIQETYQKIFPQKLEVENETEVNFFIFFKINLHKQKDYYEIPWRKNIKEEYAEKDYEAIAEEYGTIFSSDPIEEINNAIILESETIEYFEFSPNEQKICTLSKSKITLWSTENFEKLNSAEIKNENFDNLMLSWSDNEKMVAFIHDNCLAKIFETDNLTEVTEIPVILDENKPPKLIKLAWYPNNLLAIGRLRKIEFFKIDKDSDEKYSVENSEVLTNSILEVKYSWDQQGKYCLALQKHSTMKVFNMETNINYDLDFAEIEEVHGYALSFCISLDNKVFWVSFSDGLLLCFDFKSGLEIHKIKGILSHPQNLVLRKENNLISYNDKNPFISIRDTKSGSFLFKLQGRLAKWSMRNKFLGYINCGSLNILPLFWVKQTSCLYVDELYRFFVCPNDKFMAISYKNNWSLKIFELENLENLNHPFLEHFQLKSEDDEYIVALAFNPESTKLCFAQSFELTLWDLETQEKAILKTNPAKINLIKWGKKCVYFADNSGKIETFDVQTKQCILTFSHINGINVLDYNLTETKMIVNPYESKDLYLWFLEGEKRWLIGLGHEDYITDINFSPDCSKICSFDESCKMIIWNAINLRKIYMFPMNGYSSIAKWSPNGNNIALKFDHFPKCIKLFHTEFCQSYTIKGKFTNIRNGQNFFWGHDGKKFFVHSSEHNGVNNILRYDIINSDFSEFTLQKLAFEKMNKKKIGSLMSSYNYYPFGDTLLHCAVYADYANNDSNLTKAYLSCLAKFPHNFHLYKNHDQKNAIDLAFLLKRHELVYLILDFTIKYKKEIPVFHEISHSITKYFQEICEMQEPLDLKELLDSRFKLLSENETPELGPYFEGELFYGLSNERDVYFSDFYEKFFTLFNKNHKKTKKINNVNLSPSEIQSINKNLQRSISSYNEQSVICKVWFFVMDLPDVFDITKQKTFLDTVASLDPEHEIFTSEFLEKILVHKWKHYAMKYYLIEAFFYCIFVLIFIVYLDIIIPLRYKEGNKFGTYHLISVVFLINLICFTLYFIYKEIKQMLNLSFEIYKNFWNACDIIIGILLVPIIVLDCMNLFGTKDSKSLKIFGSFCMFFLITRLASYLRVFKGTAFLIRMLLQVIYLFIKFY